MTTKETRTALITGASAGIGLEIATQLGRRGFFVFLTARNQKEGKTAAEKLHSQGGNVEFIRMDVSDVRSIEETCKKVGESTPRLDVLVNNAGILLDHSINILAVKAEIVYETIHTNALSTLFVTQRFHHLLHSGSRVINVTSGGGSITGGEVSDWAPVYCISKTALNAVTLHLAQALKKEKIAVNAVCPGWVRTRMGGWNAPRSVVEGADTAVWLATDAPVTLTGKLLRDREEASW